MATLAQNYSFQPRPSTETDRRHLLAESEAPSKATSIIGSDADGDRTPRASSPARDSSRQFRIPSGRRDTIADPTPVSKPYKGFPSEAHYLAALREWADEQKYIKYDTMLSGFYGPTTLEEYASRPPVEIGLKKKWRERKAKKEERKAAERRNTVA